MLAWNNFLEGWKPNPKQSCGHDKYLTGCMKE